MLANFFGSWILKDYIKVQEKKVACCRPRQKVQLGTFTLKSCNDGKEAHKKAYCFANLRVCLHGGGGLQIGEVTCSGSPHLSCKRDRIKMKDYIKRWVTRPKRFTSPTWGPPPPCKQALNLFLFSRPRCRCRRRRRCLSSLISLVITNLAWFVMFK